MGSRCWLFHLKAEVIMGDSLPALVSFTQPCLRCVGEDGSRVQWWREQHCAVGGTGSCVPCVLPGIGRRGAGMGNSAGYQVGLLICSVTGTFFFFPTSLQC